MSEATIASLEEQLRRAEDKVERQGDKYEAAIKNGDNQDLLDFLHEQLKGAQKKEKEISDQLREARLRRDGAMVQEAVDKAVESVKIQADKEKEKAVEEAKRGPSLLGGFPGRLNVDESTSANAAKSMGTKTRLQNVNFHINLLSLFRPIFDLPKRKFAQGHAWHNYQTLAAKGFAKITTEAQIQELVRCVSLELCMMYQLDFDVKSGVGLSRGIPDVTLWRSIPFIVIEVKKFKGAFEHNAYQQVSKYLVCLRLDYGVPAPIAILTTYNGWQFCWHKYATPVAEATNIADVQRFRHELRDGDFDTLCVSPEYPCDSPFLRVLIVSLFYKMACLKHLTPVTKHCIWYSKARYQSKVADGLDPDKVDTSLEASREAKGLFFVKSLGGGAEGETYLMADKEGGCCAAKFYVLSGGKKADATPALPPAAAKKAAKEKCKKECDKWVGAYGPDCGVRVETLACSDVLLMPFFEPLSVDDWKDSGTMDIVMDHITELFDRRKVRHRDIEPRHVMWKNKIDQSVVLIDWGAATNVDANVNYASRKAYLAYAKKKLTEGIDALKKKAVADAEKQKADEAEKAEEAENTRNSLIVAMEAAKAAEAAKSEAVALASMPMRVTRSAAAAKAAKTPEALKAEEAEEAVKELDEAISNAKRASEMKEKAEQDAKAALKYARETAKAVQAATTEEKKSEAVAKAQNAAENEKAATQAAAKARRQAEAAGAALSSASWFMWKFDPVDDYEGDPRYPADDIAAMDKELQEDILKQRLEQEAKRKAR